MFRSRKQDDPVRDIVRKIKEVRRKKRAAGLEEMLVHSRNETSTGATTPTRDESSSPSARRSQAIYGAKYKIPELASNDSTDDSEPFFPHSDEYTKYRFADHISGYILPNLFRFVNFAAALTIWILGLCWNLPDSNEWAYLTKWGVIVDWVTFLCLFLISDIIYFKRFKTATDGEVPQGLRWFVATTECLQFLSVSVNVCIVLMYWICLFDGIKGAYDFFLDLCNHAILPFFIFVEFAFNRVPVRKRYLIALAILCAVYLGLNYLATKLNKPVYKIMKWDKWTTALYAAGAVALAFVGGGVQFLVRWNKIQKPIRETNKQLSGRFVEGYFQNENPYHYSHENSSEEIMITS